jgi:dissimilatory sulfite reductase (desulfoviridin) alpha/beta subunit
MPVYDTTHWEELIATIIDRIGVERFAETVAYVLEQKLEQGVENMCGSPHQPDHTEPRPSRSVTSPR